MNMQQLSTFCTVLAEGSMTAAADKLFLTQPAVSQQIRNLESELNVNLLERGVRKVRPTLQGQLLYDYAKRILYLAQQAEVSIQTMSQELHGNLNIATINSLGLFLISPIVGMFLKHNSQLSIKLDYGHLESLKEKMRKQEIDLAILPKLVDDADINEFYEEKFLLKDEMLLVGSARDTSIPKTIKLSEFASRPIVFYSQMYPSFKSLFSKMLEDNRLNFNPVFEADNVGTLKKVIESGLGWGFLPSHCIKKQIRSGRLVNIQVEDLKHSVDLCFYIKKSENIRKMSDVFYRALGQQALGKL